MRQELGIRTVLWLLVTLLIKGGVALTGHSIPWGWAVVIGFVLVFLGSIVIIVWDGDGS